MNRSIFLIALAVLAALLVRGYPDPKTGSDEHREDKKIV